jgi:MFS family permease
MLLGLTRDVRRAGRAVAVVFLANGAAYANWVARVPAIKDSVSAGTGALGLALLGIAVGSLITLPLAGRLCDRYGSRHVVTASGVAMGATVFAVSLAPNVVTLGLLLALYGGAFGLLDVAMNVQAVAVVRRVGRPIMPKFHAAFSFGGLLGAATGGLAASADIPPTTHFALVGVVVGGAVLAVRGSLLPDQAASTPVAKAPRRRRQLSPLVVGLGLVAFSAAVCEGAMADWTALFLRDVRGLDAGAAALGFAAFSITMTAGRLGGEAALRRLGPVRVLRFGGLAAATGVVAAVAVAVPAVALAGFALVGLGVCCAYPLALTTAGESSDGSGGPEIATVSVIGYSGFLLGPPVLGFLAEGVSLRYAMLAVAVPALALVALATPVLSLLSSQLRAEQRQNAFSRGR